MPSNETKSRKPWAWERESASAIRPIAIASTPPPRQSARLISGTGTNRVHKRRPFHAGSMIIDPRESSPAWARHDVPAVLVRGDLPVPSRCSSARRLADRRDDQGERARPGGERSARVHHDHQRLYLHAHAPGRLRYFGAGRLAT